MNTKRFVWTLIAFAVIYVALWSLLRDVPVPATNTTKMSTEVHVVPAVAVAPTATPVLTKEVGLTDDQKWHIDSRVKELFGEYGANARVENNPLCGGTVPGKSWGGGYRYYWQPSFKLAGGEIEITYEKYVWSWTSGFFTWEDINQGTISWKDVTDHKEVPLLLEVNKARPDQVVVRALVDVGFIWLAGINGNSVNSLENDFILNRFPGGRDGFAKALIQNPVMDYESLRRNVKPAFDWKPSQHGWVTLDKFGKVLDYGCR